MSIIFERATLKTRKGSAVKRSKWGVGKDIGGSLYVHVDYVPDEFKQMVADARTQVSIANPQFTPNIVRIDYKKGGVAFYDSVEFDTVQEPAAGMMITYKDGAVSKPRQVNQIWHHKWLWVGDDYRGFDTSQSYDRSAQWLDHDDIPFAKIGNKKTWREWLSSVNLTESLDKPAKVMYPKGDVPVGDKKPIEGLFQIGKQVYRVILIPRGIDWGGNDEIFNFNPPEFVQAVEVHFQVRGESGWTNDLTASENPMKVFATVVNETVNFAKKYNCETIATSIKDGNEKRISLYKRLFNRLGPQYGYKPSFVTHDDVTIFNLDK
ncbi:hypothetical protein KVP40.0371 [Vibrio phage KVP40]|uniref:Uncharacterized protein n=1 Tax=Vibrio phage KVP40 (isolate Vibrio parahaemolyticus/Japan/Matsuzaki/1991) TaxID=75320 RepID=Q6WHD4_BPKVM|nr:hypothetical protein KVP40.0371 [Vibrio phage KVP40]AAQ64439.1 hypothetical protein KVP40.0371 [Vibrio phage KVP40]